MLPSATARPATLDAGGAAGRLETLWQSRPVARFRINLRNPRFWVVQAMVLFVTFGHLAAELLFDPHLGAAYFIPASLTFFPILYASLNFGREGAIPTAIWAGALSLPNVAVLHQGLERAGEMFQVTTMIVLAVVVASGVDKERILERARLASERRYRGLFEAAGEPIIVFDGAGRVREANAAAAQLFGRSVGELRDDTVDNLLGAGASPANSLSVADDIKIVGGGGREVWLQPVYSEITTAEGMPLTQAVLRDVTERRGFQQFAREIVRAQEEERARISRDLHDVCLQSAVLICRSLDTAAEVVEAGEGDELTPVLSHARALAETMGDELRRFSRDLRPTILDDLGLAPALRRLASEFVERTGIECPFTLSGRPRGLADHNAELALYRIAQEALRNTERHSGASDAQVSLCYNPAGVTLTVTDNGRGFGPSRMEGAATAGHLGLLGMRERARLVGGRCAIRSQATIGTVVEAFVPVVG